MMAKAKKAGRRKGTPWKFRGLVADAAALEVTPGHLWQVLSKRRDSKKLSRRYRDLQRAKRSQPQKAKQQIHTIPT